MRKELYPKVSFAIATFNSDWCLEDNLKSIRSQDYPQDRVEIICADGGSKDKTVEIARKYKAKVINNSLRLGEPGFALACEKATGDFVVFVGVDNRLVEKDWLKRMLKPFSDPEVVAAFPHLANRKEDTWLTRYVNTFTDPFGHFVYGYADNPLTFHRYYKIKERNKDWIVFDFKPENHPVLAFDQGFTLRKKGYKRDKSTWYCDHLPMIDLIKTGKKFAYVPSASNYHVTLNKGLKQFMRKHQWIVDYNLSPQETFGLFKKPFGYKARQQYTSLKRKILGYIYPFYAISFFLPLIHSWYKYITDGEKEWLYHPFICFISAYIIWKEAFRVLILRQDPLAERQ